jgi:DNA-binding transcriptional LysR family regulator
MNISLDQARTLDAVARGGTLAAAARLLHKQPSAVVYALAQLELQAGVGLLDRSGYRNRLTPAGLEVLEHCRSVLRAVDALDAACARLRDGWEPALRVVIDGIYPIERVTRALRTLAAEGATTRVELHVEFLSGVETAFTDRRADLMLSVLRPSDASLVGVALPPVVAHLVCAPTHPLAARAHVVRVELARHALVIVRGSGRRLALPTAPLEEDAPFVLNDFHAKRAALLDGLGYGWMPEHLVAEDMAAGRLVRVDFVEGARVDMAPHAWSRAALGGRAARGLVEALRAS